MQRKIVSSPKIIPLGIDSHEAWVGDPEYDKQLTPLTVLNRIAWEEKYTDLLIRPKP